MRVGKKHWKNCKKIEVLFGELKARMHNKRVAIWRQNLETSAMCYFQQQFQPAHIYEDLIVIFIFSLLIGHG